jgi:hypothetical protein
MTGPSRLQGGQPSDQKSTKTGLSAPNTSDANVSFVNSAAIISPKSNMFDAQVEDYFFTLNQDQGGYQSIARKSNAILSSAIGSSTTNWFRQENPVKPAFFANLGSLDIFREFY